MENSVNIAAYTSMLTEQFDEPHYHYCEDENHEVVCRDPMPCVYMTDKVECVLDGSLVK